MNVRLTVRSVLVSLVFVFVAAFVLLLRFLEVPAVFGGIVLLLTLFLPTWVPLLVMDKEAQGKAEVRPFLAMVPSLWYVFLFTLAFDARRAQSILLVILLLVGEVLACLSLSICALGWRCALVIFFTVATVVPVTLVAVDAPGAVGTLLVLALVVSPIMVYLLLGLCARGWWRVLGVPLAFAILAGTIPRSK